MFNCFALQIGDPDPANQLLLLDWGQLVPQARSSPYGLDLPRQTCLPTVCLLLHSTGFAWRLWFQKDEQVLEMVSSLDG